MTQQYVVVRPGLRWSLAAACLASLVAIAWWPSETGRRETTQVRATPTQSQRFSVSPAPESASGGVPSVAAEVWNLLDPAVRDPFNFPPPSIAARPVSRERPAEPAKPPQPMASDPIVIAKPPVITARIVAPDGASLLFAQDGAQLVLLRPGAVLPGGYIVDSVGTNDARLRLPGTAQSIEVALPSADRR